jgi:hypothetical protein
MSAIANAAIRKTTDLFTAPAGLNAALMDLTKADAISIPSFDQRQVLQQNVASELVERSLDLRYPAVVIYCEKIRNELTEKFRTFSGAVRLSIEVRLTHDRLDGLQSAAETYVDAVMQVLDRSRGDWGSGMYYAGGYEADFGAVKRGGRGFLQTAKLSFEVRVSR